MSQHLISHGTANINQVMTAFLATAYITWIVVAIGYCAGVLDESLLGVLDQRLFRVKHRHSKRRTLLLEKVVLMLRSAIQS